MHSKKVPRASNESVRRVADGLRRIVQALRISTHAIERRHRVSGAQLFVLQQLPGSRGLSLHELAVLTRTDPSSVSVAVSRLAAEGLVKRTRDPDDARRAAVRISPKGATLLASAPEPAQARLLSALESLPRRDLVKLARTVEILCRAIRAPGGPAPMFFEDERRKAAGRERVHG